MLIELHPDNPQPRRLQEIAEALAGDALIAYPTDSGYAFGWRLGNRGAQDRVTRIRQLDRHHDFTLVLPDLSSVSGFAKVGNSQFRLMRKLTPGPYTFILPATRDVPRRLLHPKRRSIGIRVPGNPVAHGLLELLAEPLTSSSLLLPDLDMDYLSLEELLEAAEPLVDLVIDSGPCPLEPTTVLDLHEPVPVVLRRGAGNIDFLES